MRIGVITYDHPHRKTQDLLCRLMLSGNHTYFTEIELIVLPWVERENHKPLYSHRPCEAVNLTTDELSKRLNIPYHSCDNLDKILTKNKYDKILIGGAGILSVDFSKHKIINSHPGYLPNIRGLDALKWAILKGQPIGVSTHYICEDTDSGVIIDRKIIPIYHTDTFHSIALRQYELEISMLVESLSKEPINVMVSNNYTATKRMSHYDELRMMKRLKLIINGI